jgi:CRP/FNR family transcriptional regulator
MQATDSLASSLGILNGTRNPLAQVPGPQTFPTRCRQCSSRKSGFFCDLGHAALDEYQSISTPLSLPENGILFCEGQKACSVWVICEGRLKLTRSSRHGKTLLVRIARAGDALGLSAALSNMPYEVTAQAIEPVQLRTIDRNDFLDFIRRYGEGSMRAAESISREYRAVMSDAYRLALSTSIAGRVAHLLLEFARESKTLDQPQPEIHMALKHEELAFKLGSTRESVTRVLNELKRGGVLSVKGTRMVLLNKNALERLL